MLDSRRFSAGTCPPMHVFAMESKGVISLFVIAFFVVVFVTLLIMGAMRYDAKRAEKRRQASNEEHLRTHEVSPEW